MSNFVKDVSILASGTIFAQILAILAAPIITRLYGPDIYGTMSLFVSITSIVSMISCLCYEYSIVLAENDKEAANMLMVSLSLVFLISLLTTPVIYVLRNVIPTWLNDQSLGPLLWIIPPAVLIGGVLIALSYWCTRKNEFRQLSAARVGNSLGTTSIQLGSGFAGHATAESLVVANVFGSLTAILFLCRKSWLSDRDTLRNDVRLRCMMEGLKRYRKFPIFHTWSILLNTVSWQLPIILLSAFFSPSVAGYYALGNAVVRAPMNLFSSSIAQVFYRKAIEANRQGNLSIIVEELFRRLVIWGLFPMLLLTIVGRDVFLIIFGDNWAEAGVYAQILAVWTFFWFVSGPLSSLFEALEKQEMGLIWNLCNFLTRLFSLLLGGWLHDSRTALLLFACSGIAVYGYLAAKMLSLTGVSIKKAGLIIQSHMMLFLPAGALLISLKHWNDNPLINLLVAALLLAAYFAFSAIHDKEIRAFIIGIARRTQ